MDGRAARRDARPRRRQAARRAKCVFRGADGGTVDGVAEPIRFERSLQLDDARDGRSPAGLRDERRAAARPARLPAAPGCARLVRRCVGQVADRDRGDRSTRSPATTRPTSTSTSANGTADRARAGHAAARAGADHRAGRDARGRARRSRDPRRGLVGRGADRARRSERGRRTAGRRRDWWASESVTAGSGGS